MSISILIVDIITSVVNQKTFKWSFILDLLCPKTIKSVIMRNTEVSTRRSSKFQVSASLKIHGDYKTLLEDDFCKNETNVSNILFLNPFRLDPNSHLNRLSWGKGPNLAPPPPL